MRWSPDLIAKQTCVIISVTWYLWQGLMTKHPKFGLDTAALWQYANEPYHVVSNFSICWLTFPKVWGYFSWSNDFANLSRLILDDPDILILHSTNYFCCSSSWLMLNNWKLTHISFCHSVGHGCTSGLCWRSPSDITFVTWLSGMAGCAHIWAGQIKSCFNSILSVVIQNQVCSYVVLLLTSSSRLVVKVFVVR